MDKSLQAILIERNRQDRLWGDQDHDPFTYLAILIEEVGEFAKEALTLRFETSKATMGQAGSTAEYEKSVLEDMRVEAVQVAAVALAIVECLDRKKWSWPKSQAEEEKR